MKTDRLIRVNELIRREIAANLHRFIHGQDVNLAAVTITRVVVSSNLRTARVWVSLFKGDRPATESEAVTGVLAVLFDRRKEIQSHLGRTLKLKYTPRLFFEADDSLALGDQVLSILDDLPIPDDAADPPDDPLPDTGGSPDA